MPRGDRTGPNGMGPMTGRAAGLCTGNDRPGFMNPQAGRGMGIGRGAGRGMGRGMGRGFGGYAYTGQNVPQESYTPGTDVLTAPQITQDSAEKAPVAFDQLRQDIASLASSLESLHSRIGALEKAEPSE